MSLLSRLLGRLTRTARRAVPPSLPGLEHEETLEAADWIRASMTTFGGSVGSFVPGGFEAYARVYHPWRTFDGSGAPPTPWREVAARKGIELGDGVACEALAGESPGGLQVEFGNLDPSVIGALLEHLGRATTTPERCWFALWEGFADSVVPLELEPRLELPGRRYHLFRGPLEAARTNLSEISWHPRSPNLWWPADRAWCVATEVDHAWSYVGGSRSCVKAILADPRLEARETTADASW